MGALKEQLQVLQFLTNQVIEDTKRLILINENNEMTDSLWSTYYLILSSHSFQFLLHDNLKDIYNTEKMVRIYYNDDATVTSKLNTFLEIFQSLNTQISEI